MTKFFTIYSSQRTESFKTSPCFKQFKQFFISKTMCNSYYPFGYKYFKI